MPLYNHSLNETGNSSEIAIQDYAEVADSQAKQYHRRQHWDIMLFADSRHQRAHCQRNTQTLDNSFYSLQTAIQENNLLKLKRYRSRVARKEKEDALLPRLS
jgi:hypothetical protein